MQYNLESIQNFGKEQVEAAQTAAAEFSKGLQTIAAEATDYSKKSLESSSAFIEKLLGVKKIDEAITLHSEFAKTSYESFVTQATKFGELYADLAKTALKPIEGVFSKVQSAVTTKSGN